MIMILMLNVRATNLTFCGIIWSINCWNQKYKKSKMYKTGANDTILLTLFNIIGNQHATCNIAMFQWFHGSLLPSDLPCKLNVYFVRSNLILYHKINLFHTK